MCGRGGTLHSVPPRPGAGSVAQATGYAPETGRLGPRPDSPAHTTQFRLLTARIIATANDHVGSSVVRALRVLSPGTVDTTPPPAAGRPAPKCGRGPGRAGEPPGAYGA
ncbi:hypothetical protein GCM10017667_69140 [Streptomyces filamentosus]|uniref:Uncharacterized protein n=1 Tax=Streptomyces filamentosus TaxID=67294 RepID=A0A919ETB3_STRFL|nr:hypothetical protein GCM10017667_69140 [Streptomyces filamentosus]